MSILVSSRDDLEGAATPSLVPFLGEQWHGRLNPQRDTTALSGSPVGTAV